ncbi:MAG: hypothetical protein D6794_02975 [Deltaproteobacteria bacterium]|nr:MAG: hypothetical protein D6794_02975 [Deltaproteobacteria bacterium]
MKPTINLATQQHLNRRAVYTVYLIIAALLLFWLGSHIYYLSSGRTQMARLDAHIAEMSRQLGIDRQAPPVSEEEFQALLKKIRFANQVIERDSYRWSLLLSHLEQVLPDNVRIRSVRPMFKEGKIQLAGEAKQVDDLRRLLDNLVQASFFGEVFILSQQLEQNQQGERLVGFNLEVIGGVQ